MSRIGSFIDATLNYLSGVGAPAERGITVTESAGIVPELPSGNDHERVRTQDGSPLLDEALAASIQSDTPDSLTSGGSHAESGITVTGSTGIVPELASGNDPRRVRTPTGSPLLHKAPPVSTQSDPLGVCKDSVVAVSPATGKAEVVHRPGVNVQPQGISQNSSEGNTSPVWNLPPFVGAVDKSGTHEGTRSEVENNAVAYNRREERGISTTEKMLAENGAGRESATEHETSASVLPQPTLPRYYLVQGLTKPYGIYDQRDDLRQFVEYASYDMAKLECYVLNFPEESQLACCLCGQRFEKVSLRIYHEFEEDHR